MDIIIYVLYALEIVIFAYFLVGTLYFAVFSVAGLFPYHVKKPLSAARRTFAVFIPGYKEDMVIVNVAKHALEQNYPKDYYDVIVIADSFQPSTLEKLRELSITLIEVSFEKSSKARALNKAMSQIDKKYDAAIILDADNIMEIDFISHINEALSRGFIAIQGHRKAKNRNTSFAILDSVSEEINNHIFRKGHRVLGLSSALIGSGMGFDYQVFKNYMAVIDSFGEDKELEISLLRDNIIIEYCENAIVYDEKVQKSKTFVTQRTRWLANQFIYARENFHNSLIQLFRNKNLDFFDKIFQQMLPPRIFLLGFLFILTLLSLVFRQQYFLWLWFGLTSLCVLSLLISIPRPLYNLGTLKAVFSLPQGFFFMLLSLFRIYKAKQGFGHTVHTTSSTLDPLNEK